MNSTDTDIKHLQTKCESLEKKLKTFQSNLSRVDNKHLYSREVYMDWLLRLRIVASGSLEEMFGSGSRATWASAGAPGDLFFSFNKQAADHHPEGLHVAYYVPFAERLRESARAANRPQAVWETPFEYRKTIFSTGARWCNKVLTLHFYDYLGQIAQRLPGTEYPLDFWQTFSTPHNYLMIRTGVAGCSSDGCLGMPHVCEDLNLLKDSYPMCCAAWETIYNAKNAKLTKEALTEIELKLLRGQVEFVGKSQHAPEISRFFHRLIEFTGSNEVLVQKERIFRLITLYHCYDAPYVIHLFTFGEQKRERGTWAGRVPEAAIALTVPCNQGHESLDNSSGIFFNALCKTISRLHNIEDKLATCRSRDTVLLWKLESKYQSQIPAYTLLIELLRTLLGAVCAQAEIPTQVIDCRVKDPVSLFEKLCLRANASSDKRKSNEPPSRWKEATIKCDLDFIKKSMCDLGGVRIVCNFQSDVERVKAEIWKLVLDGDLEFRIPYKVSTDDYSNVMRDYTERAFYNPVEIEMSSKVINIVNANNDPTVRTRLLNALLDKEDLLLRDPTRCDIRTCLDSREELKKLYAEVHNAIDRRGDAARARMDYSSSLGDVSGLFNRLFLEYLFPEWFKKIRNEKRSMWDDKKPTRLVETTYVVEGYAGTHCDVQLGDRRRVLPEYRGLRDMICEIQIRSAVASAWAGASHLAEYKPGYPREAFRDSTEGRKVKESLCSAASILVQADSRLDEAKVAFDSYGDG